MEVVAGGNGGRPTTPLKMKSIKQQMNIDITDFSNMNIMDMLK